MRAPSHQTWVLTFHQSSPSQSTPLTQSPHHRVLQPLSPQTKNPSIAQSPHHVLQTQSPHYIRALLLAPAARQRDEVWTGPPGPWQLMMLVQGKRGHLDSTLVENTGLGNWNVYAQPWSCCSYFKCMYLVFMFKVQCSKTTQSSDNNASIKPMKMNAHNI